MNIRMKLTARILLIAACATNLVCAAASRGPESSLRVLVYNIHAGRDDHRVENLQRVADLIQAHRAGIVLLQEVDRHTARSGNVDQLERIARMTKLHSRFGKSLDYQGGQYGIAILSRWPIGRSEIVPLRTDPAQPRAGGSLEPRIALVVETGPPGRPLRVVNTHLDASREETYRLQEVEELLRRGPFDIAGGDFNATPESDVIRLVGAAGLRDTWRECGSGDGFTYPVGSPVKRIDYLFIGSGLACRSAIVLDSQASDHRALLVELVTKGPRFKRALAYTR